MAAQNLCPCLVRTRMDAIPEKAVRTEKNRRGRFSHGAREREELLFEVANKTLGASDYSVKGKCD